MTLLRAGLLTAASDFTFATVLEAAALLQLPVVDSAHRSRALRGAAHDLDRAKGHPRSHRLEGSRCMIRSRRRSQDNRETLPERSQMKKPARRLTAADSSAAMVTFAGMKELKAGKAAFKSIVREWIGYIQQPKD
jgi:hypothetical protein